MPKFKVGDTIFFKFYDLFYLGKISNVTNNYTLEILPFATVKGNYNVNNLMVSFIENPGENKSKAIKVYNIDLIKALYEKIY